jgi:hypothetical protein
MDSHEIAEMETASIEEEEPTQPENNDAPVEKDMENIPSNLTNPLSTEPSTYMSAANGMAC